MTPEQIAELREIALQLLDHGDAGGISLDATVSCGEFLGLLATAEREAKLREACEDYLKWVRTPHHHLPIQETINQRREILERMEAALESKGGE